MNDDRDSPKPTTRTRRRRRRDDDEEEEERECERIASPLSLTRAVDIVVIVTQESQCEHDDWITCARPVESSRVSRENSEKAHPPGDPDPKKRTVTRRRRRRVTTTTNRNESKRHGNGARVNHRRRGADWLRPRPDGVCWSSDWKDEADRTATLGYSCGGDGAGRGEDGAQRRGVRSR